jgi:hypothetical protein
LDVPAGIWNESSNCLRRGAIRPPKIRLYACLLVWWRRNIEGEIELDGKIYPRYLIWHPIDHSHFEVMHRMPDGTVDVGSTFHLVEALGANMRNLLDLMLRLAQLNEAGARVELHVFGRVAMQIQGQFVPQSAGTQVISTMTLGSQGPFGGRLGLNRLLIDWFFPEERRKAWLKHSVEEIGNLQLFLPKLYERHARDMSQRIIRVSAVAPNGRLRPR